MQYDVSLSVAYRFDAAASASRNVVRLMPADLVGEQRLTAGELTVTPTPDEWISRTDYFRNATVEVAFHEAHREITFAVTSRMHRYERGRRLDMSPPVAKLGADIAAYRRLDPASPHHFVGPSRRVPLDGGHDGLRPGDGRRNPQRARGGGGDRLRASTATGPTSPARPPSRHSRWMPSRRAPVCARTSRTS